MLPRIFRSAAPALGMTLRYPWVIMARDMRKIEQVLQPLGSVHFQTIPRRKTKMQKQNSVDEVKDEGTKEDVSSDTIGGGGLFDSPPFLMTSAEASETDEAFTYSFKVSDDDSKSVKVKIVGERLLKVEHELDSKSASGEFMSQRSSRTIVLPANSKPSDLKAEFEENILLVTVPKNLEYEEPPKEREIPVKHCSA